jgi:hypothetical protein
MIIFFMFYNILIYIIEILCNITVVRLVHIVNDLTFWFFIFVADELCAMSLFIVVT